jgi:hypothetical protein
MSAALESLLLRFGEGDDLRSKLQWLEDAAFAASAATSDLGEPASRAALHLRAALGAFVEFSRGPQGDHERLALEMSVRTLTTHALHDLYGALAQSYRELGEADTPYRAECRELSRLWSMLEHAIEKGHPIRGDVFKKLEAIRARVEAQREQD